MQNYKQKTMPKLSDAQILDRLYLHLVLLDHARITFHSWTTLPPPASIPLAEVLK